MLKPPETGAHTAHPHLEGAQQHIDSVLENVGDFVHMNDVEHEHPDIATNYSHVDLDSPLSDALLMDDAASIRLFHPKEVVPAHVSEEWRDLKRVANDFKRDITILCTWTLSEAAKQFRSVATRARKALNDQEMFQQAAPHVVPAYAAEDNSAPATLAVPVVYEQQVQNDEFYAEKVPNEVRYTRQSIQVTHISSIAHITIRIARPLLIESAPALTEHPLLIEDILCESAQETVHVEPQPYGTPSRVYLRAIKIVAGKLRQGVDI